MDGCRRRRDGREGQGEEGVRILGAVEMGEARKREEAEAMSSRSDGRDSAAAEFRGFLLATECEKRQRFFVRRNYFGVGEWGDRNLGVGDAVHGGVDEV